MYVCVCVCFSSSFASFPPSLSTHFFSSSFHSPPSTLFFSLSPPPRFTSSSIIPHYTPSHPSSPSLPFILLHPSPLHPITGVTMWRSSQPKCGVSGTCTADEKLLDLIAQSCVFKRTPTGTVKATGDPLLCIIDCRPKVSGSGSGGGSSGSGSGSGSGGSGTGSVIVITIICIIYQ